jgi:alanyl aminopeptidase
VAAGCATAQPDWSAPALAPLPPGAKVPGLRLPDGVRPLHYTVSLRIVPGEPSFTGTVDIDLALASATSLLWLDGTDLQIRDAQLTSGRSTAVARVVDGGADHLGFAFDPPIGPGAARLRVSYRGKMYQGEEAGVFQQKEGDDWYQFTQFEAVDARRAFPCFDEPSFKVPWRLELMVKKEHVALSNTPPLRETDVGGGFKIVSFTETQPLPSYLVAFAVGPFQIVEAGRAGQKNTAIRVITTGHRGGEAHHATLASAPLLALLEKIVGLPYPYEKLDLLAVPQFSGAMENPGLITFGAGILLSRPEEEAVRWRRSYASTFAHEVAHQWFGNLVTAAWWDDIWLNEAFASWLGARAVDLWKPEWDGAVSRVNDRAGALSEDTLASARKIRQPILSRDDIANAFDGITYQKGRAVLEMFEAWLGPETFGRGMRRYLEAHASKNATSANFVAAISAAAGRDLAPAFSTFLDQVGAPLVSVELACPPRAPPRVTVSQTRYLPAGSAQDRRGQWQIPVCLHYGGDRGEGRQCLLLAEPRAEVELTGVGHCPQWMLGNDRMTGYYRTRVSPVLMARLLEDGGKRLSLPERVGLLSDVSALVEGGEIEAAAALELLPAVLREGGGNRHVVAATVAMVAGLDEDLVPDELRPNYARLVRKLYGARAAALGWKAKAADDEDTRLLRRTLVQLVADQGEDGDLGAEARRLALAWADDRQAVDPDIVDVVLHVAARRGDRALFDRLRGELARTRGQAGNPQDASKDASRDVRRDRRRIIGALAAFEDPALVSQGLALVLGGELDPRESLGLLFRGRHGSVRPQPGDLAYQFLKSNYDAVVARLPGGKFAGGDMAAELPYVVASACDESQRADAASFFKSRMDRTVGGPRVLQQVLEGIELCTRRKARQQASVAAFLRRW